MPGSLLRPVLAGALALAGSLAISAAATAAPITVHLRVEGAAATLFDGNVTTDGRMIAAPTHGSSAAPTPHPCNLADNGQNGGYGPRTATPISALYDAAVKLGVPFAATWYSSLNDFLVDGFGTETGPDAASNWGYAVNYTTAGVGGCQFQLAPGSDVLWASNFFPAGRLLKLAGPSAAGAGAPVQVTVTDGSTGQPVQGAAVGGALTNASGNATISFPAAGESSVKAEKSDSVRSAALTICVHNGNDGTCGTTAPNGTSTPIPVAQTGTGSVPAGAPAVSAAPLTQLLGVVNGHRYRRGRGPRVLHGYITAAKPLKAVRIRLTRRARGRCSYYSGRLERFLPARCGKGFFFTVGTASTFNYLLPAPLSTGHYSLELESTALDGSADAKLQRGRNWSVFDVG